MSMMHKNDPLMCIQRSFAVRFRGTSELQHRQGKWNCRDQSTRHEECSIRAGYQAGRHPAKFVAEVEQGNRIDRCISRL